MRAEGQAHIDRIDAALALVRQSLDWDHALRQLDELDARVQDPTLWDDPKQAQAITQEQKRLETAINTDVPGYVRAVVSQDVRSFDGTKILVPRSSRLIGQYQSGLQGGQKRAYVIWTRVIRPDGASVNLASPAVSFDGTTGLAGDVESNFFRRFGSAMLLSVVGGLGALASGGASIVLGGAGQSAAAAAVQQDGQVGPTVRVRQGEPIRVFTARDLDFSTVS